MIIKQATQVGNPLIRKKCKAVKISEIKSPKTKKIIRDLTDSMRHHGLVGMAANQIGKDARIFVSEIRTTSHRKTSKSVSSDPLRVFINPKLTEVSEQTSLDWEGCGSVAEIGLFGKVPRPSRVTVEACDEKGDKFTLKANGLLARIIQHEVDHLNGVIFADKCSTSTFMSKSEYLMMRKKSGS